MEALKKNGFAIALSVVIVAALVLLYVFVIGRAVGSGTLKVKKDAIQTQLTQLKGYGDKRKTPDLPTEAAKIIREDGLKKLKEAIDHVQLFYRGRKEKFSDIPEAFTGDSESPVGFKSFYEKRIDEMTKEYRDAFAKTAAVPATEGAAPADPAAPAQPAVAAQPAGSTPPAVVAAAAAAAAPTPAQPSRGSTGEAQEDKIVDAMAKIEKGEDIHRATKELWLVEEVFKGATDLKIGGIRGIRFPGRVQAMAARAAESVKKESKKDGKEAAKVAPRTFDLINMQVSMEMPLGQLEPFLARLLQSERALLRLESLEVRNKLEALQTKVLLVKTYQTDQEAGKDSSDSLLAEPPVTIQLTLAAIDWIGKPEEPTAQ